MVRRDAPEDEILMYVGGHAQLEPTYMRISSSGASWRTIRPLPQHLLSERDTAPGALSIELINNFDSDNIHAYIQTTGEGTDQKVLIKADGTQYTPVAKSKYVPTFIPQKTDCRRLGNCQVGLCLSGVLRNGGLPKVCRM